MKYYSLNRVSPDTSFKEAAILGQAPDKEDVVFSPRSHSNGFPEGRSEKY